MQKLSIVESVIGILALDENNAIVDFVTFPREPREIAERLTSIQMGKITSEFSEVATRVAPKCQILIVESGELAKSLRESLNHEVLVEKPSNAASFVRANLGEVAVQIGYLQKPEDAFELLRNVSTVLTRLRVTEAVEKRDQVAIQLIHAIDEIDKTSNVLAGRITEWYGLHFPELSRIIDSHDTYAKLVSQIGLRENIREESLNRLGITGERAKRLIKAAENSVGGLMNIDDLAALQSFCRSYLDTIKLRDHLVEKLDGVMHKVAKNMKALAGATLGARLIALAGGLDRLSRFAASTIQILGAEKALFRSLKTGAHPPKHGVIFQHYLVHQAARWQRGKIARALAGKIAIAGRIDAFSGSDMSKALKADLDKRVKEIQDKYRAPPEREPKQQAKDRKRKRR